MQDKLSIDSILDSIKMAISNARIPDKKAPIELTNVVQDADQSLNEQIFEDEIRKMLKSLLKPYLQFWIKNNIRDIVKEVVAEEYKNSNRDK